MTKITVYSKPNCGACELTKNWLKENNIDFTAVDASENQEAMDEIILHGFLGFPVVTVGNFDNAWSGFNYQRLEELKR